MNYPARMASRTEVINVCDFCGHEAAQDSQEVKSHLLAVDGGRARQVEACDPCWDSTPVTKLYEVGRKPK